MPLFLKYEKISGVAWLFLSEILYKIAVACRWLQGYKHDVSLIELLKVVLFTNRFSLGASNISRVVEVDKYLEVHIKKISKPFYFPKKGYLTMLYILGENFSPISWHYYETKETPITKDDIVVDCGAGVGTFTLSATNNAKKVYAIEPFKESLQPLRLTFKNNKKVEILPVAVGEKDKRAYMFGNIFGYGIQNSQTPSPIKVTTIDKLFFEKGKKITYLKADLEGFEMNMLKGAINTIKKYKPKITITTYHKKDDHLKFMKFLIKLNPDYKFSLRGIAWRNGNPIMLHAW